MDLPDVAGALRVVAVPEAEVEANCDQVGNVAGSGVRGYGFRGDNGLIDS